MSTVEERLIARIATGTIIMNVGVIVSLVTMFVFAGTPQAVGILIGILAVLVGGLRAVTGVARLQFVDGRTWQVSSVTTAVAGRTWWLAERIIVRVPDFDPGGIYSLGWLRTAVAAGAIAASENVIVTGGRDGRAMLATIDGRTVLPLRAARSSQQRGSFAA